MNDLTGAFVYAFDKKIDPNIIRKSLLNAGYPIQEIEGALRESEQINALEILKRKEKSSKLSKKKIFFLLLVFLILLILGGFVVWYFFLRGKESELFSSLLGKINSTK